MPRLALISDIHGNCVGLDAVLADATVQGADEIVCLGDVAAGGVGYVNSVTADLQGNGAGPAGDVGMDAGRRWG